MTRDEMDLDIARVELVGDDRRAVYISGIRTAAEQACIFAHKRLSEHAGDPLGMGVAISVSLAMMADELEDAS